MKLNTQPIIQRIIAGRQIIFVFLFLWVGLSACKIRFTFSGTKVPENIKTITIEQFENNARLISPSLAQDFSETLRDFFLKRTNMRLVSSGGDVVITGEISQYEIKPINVQENALASQNRLSLSIKTTLESESYPELNWSDSFSNFADFDATKDFSSLEKSLQDEINQKIAQDIFNKTFGQW